MATIILSANVRDTTLSRQYIATIPNFPIMKKRKRITYKVDVLYQNPPKRYNTYEEIPYRRSWTNSLETYQNSARREYELLKANHRTAEHLITPNNPIHMITLKHFREYNNLEVIALWKEIRATLKMRDVIAYGVIEITTRRQYVSDKEYYDYPINKVHYHFFVDSHLSERQLRYVFNRVCLEVGLNNKRPNREFEIQYDVITNRKEFLRKCMYVLKYKRYKHEAILFKPKTGINKIYQINDWFINADGTRASKKKMWEDLIDGWYPQNTTSVQGQSIKITIQFSIPITVATSGNSKKHSLKSMVYAIGKGMLDAFRLPPFG
jgi:hypothetical protein